MEGDQLPTWTRDQLQNIRKTRIREALDAQIRTMMREILNNVQSAASAGQMQLVYQVTNTGSLLPHETRVYFDLILERLPQYLPNCLLSANPEHTRLTISWM